MNLVKCKACEREISPKALRCPQCGEPTEKRQTAVIAVCATATIVIGLLFRASTLARCQFWRYRAGYEASQIRLVALAGEAIPHGAQNKSESLLESGSF